MPIKDIYIAHEEGLELVAPLAKEAIQEIMDCFPAYKDAYPITNLGNWKDTGYLTVQNESKVLKPYKSIDYYIANAAQQAISDGRATGCKIKKDGNIKVYGETDKYREHGQISIDTLFNDLSNDPYAKKIPQIKILLTKHDLYGTQSNGTLLNFCLGVSKEDAFSIVSISRFIGPDGKFDKEGFKTVVMHEFGHAIGLTREGRTNTYQSLGSHCADENCIMQQSLTGDFTAMTQNRLNRKEQGLAPICKDCIAEGEKYFKSKLIEQLEKAKAEWAKAGLPDEDLPKKVSLEALDYIQNRIALKTGQRPRKLRPTLNVGTTTEDPSPELDWIKAKRKFWKEYANSIDNTFENDSQKDTESRTFSCALSKGDKQGEIKYTAPDKVQISKESHLEMYSGLVKDAVKNNLSITFGSSLDDKQKAMLLAACLMNKEKYQDGSELAIINPPTIDMNAEYINELPDDVKKILDDYVKAEQKRTQQQTINQKLTSVKDKLKDNASTGSIDERLKLREEQARIIHEIMTPEQQQAHQQKEIEREKIRAARLGIQVADMPEDLKKRVGGNEAQNIAQNSLDKRFTDKNGNVDTQARDAYIAALKAKYER